MNQQDSASPQRKRKRNRGLHLSKKIPRIPMRGIWDAATPDQRAKAHRQAMAILEYWLGYSTKAELAKALEVPPLRIWQMSQLASSGMVIALLHQPKMRINKVKELLKQCEEEEVNPSEDPKLLLRKIHALERTVEIQTKLIEILREFPSQKGVKLPLAELSALTMFKKHAKAIPTPPRQKQNTSSPTKSQGTGSTKKRGRPRKEAQAADAATTAETTDLPPGARHESERVPGAGDP